MPNKVIAVLLVVSVASFAIYLFAPVLVGPPSDIRPMGDESTWMQYVALATSVVSLVTALAGLLRTMLEMRRR